MEKTHYSNNYKHMKRYFILLTVAILFVACEDQDDPGIQQTTITASFIYKDDLDHFTLICTSIGEIDEYQWSISDNQQIVILSPTTNEAIIELTSEATIASVRLTVKNARGSSTCSNIIDLPKLTFTRKFGLGRDITHEQSNNVNYEWYMCQIFSGTYSVINCGPTCATMAIKWANPDFSKTLEGCSVYLMLISQFRNFIPELHPFAICFIKTPQYQYGFCSFTCPFHS